MIAAHQLTSGALVACSLLGGRAVAPLGQIAQLLSRLTATRTAYRQLDAMMAMPVEGGEGEPLRPSASRAGSSSAMCLPLSRRCRKGAERGQFHDPPR
jgi:ATP-binding cassette subfamily C protein LapB